MKVFRWIVRMLGVSFLTVAFTVGFFVLIWPRWFTVVAVEVIGFCFTIAGVLCVVASFMPNLDKLKPRDVAGGKAKQSFERLVKQCRQCEFISKYYCKEHNVALCRAHGNEHSRAGCIVTEIAPDATESMKGGR